MAKRVGDTVRPESREPATFGHQVRSYVLDPYTKVKDSRSGRVTADVYAILDGDLDDFMIEAMIARAEARRAKPDDA